MRLLTFINGTQYPINDFVTEQKTYLGHVELRATIYKKDVETQFLEIRFIDSNRGSDESIQSRLYKNPRYINHLYQALSMIEGLTRARDLDDVLYQIGVVGKNCESFLSCLNNAVYSAENIPELVRLADDERFDIRMFADLLADPVIHAGFNAFVNDNDSKLDDLFTFAAQEISGRMEIKTYHEFIDIFREVISGYVTTAVDRVVKTGSLGIDSSLNDFKIASAAYEASRARHIPTPPERKSGSGFKRHVDKGFVSASKRDRNDVTVPKEYGLKEEHELTHDERLALGVLEKMFGKAVARAMIRGKELGFIRAKESSVVDLDVEVEYEVTVIINLSK